MMIYVLGRGWLLISANITVLFYILNDKLMDMLSITSCAADHESLWTADNSEFDEANCGSSTECGCGSGETRSRSLGHQASCS